jgi:hypothetical protein
MSVSAERRLGEIAQDGLGGLSNAYGSAQGQDLQSPRAGKRGHRRLTFAMPVDRGIFAPTPTRRVGRHRREERALTAKPRPCPVPREETQHGRQGRQQR